MKICSLYGAGFYYIPGTDTCIKIGGFVRTEWMHNAGGSFTPSVTGTGATYDRSFSDTQNRSRAAITTDVRSQTEYGTLRSYMQWGWDVTNNVSGFYKNRAFIQLAGFTAGLSSSFFDNFGFAAYSNQTNYIGSDVGGGGINVIGYTAQLGNGLSASVAIEDANVRRTLIVGTASGGTFSTTTGAAVANNTFNSNAYGGAHLPDFTGNLRVDQAWGSAQVMGAIHEVYPGQFSAGSHHGTKYGYALGAGVTFNLPMLGKGDNIAAQFVYANGATGYNVRASALKVVKGGNTISAASVDDATCGTIAQGCELTKSWSVVAGYNHGWNAKWKSSIYGGYVKSTYGSTAETIQAATSGGLDYSFWQLGSRTVWTPVANLDLSVDVMYNHLNGSTRSSTAGHTSDDTWAGVIRAQRNFWP